MVSINFCLCSLLSCLHLIASCLCFETTPCNWMQNKRLTVAVASSDSHFHMIPCDVKQQCKTKSSIMLHSPIRDSLYPSSSFNIQCWKKCEVSSATIRCQMEECDLVTVEAPPLLMDSSTEWSLCLCHCVMMDQASLLHIQICVFWSRMNMQWARGVAQQRDDSG